MSNITKEGIEVKPGQIWQDLDVRSNGKRLVQILSVKEGRAECCNYSRFGRASKLRTKLSVRRMHKHSTGWKLWNP